MFNSTRFIKLTLTLGLKNLWVSGCILAPCQNPGHSCLHAAPVALPWQSCGLCFECLRPCLHRGAGHEALLRKVRAAI